MPKTDGDITDSIAELKRLEQDEPIASFLGMKLVELTPGYSRVTMKLKPEHQNFNGFVFGGVISAIADQAFAYASNSLSYPSVATQFNFHFVNGAGADDELTAECRVVRSGRRVGISQMTVTNQDGKLIATATGTTIPVNRK
jgi:acyl-CoA thioesterase